MGKCLRLSYIGVVLVLRANFLYSARKPAFLRGTDIKIRLRCASEVENRHMIFKPVVFVGASPFLQWQVAARQVSRRLPFEVRSGEVSRCGVACRYPAYAVKCCF